MSERCIFQHSIGFLPYSDCYGITLFFYHHNSYKHIEAEIHSKKSIFKVYAQAEKYPEAYAYIDEYDQSYYTGYSYP